MRASRPIAPPATVLARRHGIRQPRRPHDELDFGDSERADAARLMAVGADLKLATGE
jgi:hypothetical protein